MKVLSPQSWIKGLVNLDMVAASTFYAAADEKKKCTMDKIRKQLLDATAYKNLRELNTMLGALELANEFVSYGFEKDGKKVEYISDFANFYAGDQLQAFKTLSEKVFTVSDNSPRFLNSLTTCIDRPLRCIVFISAYLLRNA